MLCLEAPAKINWLLYVLGKRDDGYHEILSLMQKVDLCDRLSLAPRENEIALESDLPIPAGENLVMKAALLLKREAGTGKGAHIKLEKAVPLQAGLGGGSSDAAAALVGLNKLWGLGLSSGDLAQLGGKLGSDVPFFLGHSLAIAGGRGESLEPAGESRALYLLIVKPLFGVQTAWAYMRLKGYTKLTKAHNNIKIFLRALRKGDFDALREFRSGNDLEAGVLGAFPEIMRIKSGLREKGAVYSAMTGSGSAVFGLFPDKGLAEKAAREVCLSWWCRVVRSIL
jgi:4-diphosphocytidyl-2-C-methyl-D-erythritol kinase